MGIRTVSIGPLRDIVAWEDGDTFEDGTPIQGFTTTGAGTTAGGVPQSYGEMGALRLAIDLESVMRLSSVGGVL